MAAVTGIGGSVQVVDAFDELVQEGGAGEVRGTIPTEQAAGAALESGLSGHLGAYQVTCFCVLGVAGPAHADSP